MRRNTKPIQGRRTRPIIQCMQQHKDIRWKVQLNIDSEQKCLQSRLETVHGRRVANGARQPVPCRRTCDDKCTSAELCLRPLNYHFAASRQPSSTFNAGTCTELRHNWNQMRCTTGNQRAISPVAAGYEYLGKLLIRLWPSWVTLMWWRWSSGIRFLNNIY